MTLTDLLPVRLGLFDRAVPRTRHRAIDKAERLEFLLAGANALIKGLRLQLDDMHHEHAETIARIDERHAEVVRQLENHIADLERRLDVRVLAEHVVAKTQEIPVITPVMPLHQAPFATTDPGRVPPSWAKPDTTA